MLWINGIIEKLEGKKYYIIGNYMLDKILNKIKEKIGIEKLDDTKF